MTKWINTGCNDDEGKNVIKLNLYEERIQSLPIEIINLKNLINNIQQKEKISVPHTIGQQHRSSAQRAHSIHQQKLQRNRNLQSLHMALPQTRSVFLNRKEKVKKVKRIKYITGDKCVEKIKK